MRKLALTVFLLPLFVKFVSACSYVEAVSTEKSINWLQVYCLFTVSSFIYYIVVNSSLFILWRKKRLNLVFLFIGFWFFAIFSLLTILTFDDSCGRYRQQMILPSGLVVYFIATVQIFIYKKQKNTDIT